MAFPIAYFGQGVRKFEAPYFVRHYQVIDDIKKGSFNKKGSNELRYNTFIRITVKPSFDSVGIEVKSKNSVVAH